MKHQLALPFVSPCVTAGALLGSEEAEGESKITTKGGVVLKGMVLRTLFSWNHGLAPFTRLKLVEKTCPSAGTCLQV